jgi:septum formation protein
MPLCQTDPLILASASPRREELLRQVGLKFKIRPAEVNEDQLPLENPREHVRRLAGNKAATVAAHHPDAWVLGADTIVVIDGLILGKPQDKKQAKEMLQRLSGREHEVFTGFTIVRVTAKISKTKVIRSAVRFKQISPEELEWYTDCAEPYDKAGGYAVQGKIAYFIKSIRGSYTNVIGLPLSEVLEELKKLGALYFR